MVNLSAAMARFAARRRIGSEGCAKDQAPASSCHTQQPWSLWLTPHVGSSWVGWQAACSKVYRQPLLLSMWSADPHACNRTLFLTTAQLIDTAVLQHV